MDNVRQKALLIARTCACTRVRQASRSISRAYEEVLRPTGLTATQFSILVATSIMGSSGLTMAKLSELMVLDRTSLTRILKPMVKDGVIVVRSSEADARVRLVALTPAGIDKFAEASQLWDKAQADFEARVGPATWAPVGEGLRKIIQTMTA
jgi:DNA-binding MarR family transcriptional regulator